MELSAISNVQPKKKKKRDLAGHIKSPDLNSIGKFSFSLKFPFLKGKVVNWGTDDDMPE